MVILKLTKAEKIQVINEIIANWDKEIFKEVIWEEIKNIHPQDHQNIKTKLLEKYKLL